MLNNPLSRPRKSASATVCEARGFAEAVLARTGRGLLRLRDVSCHEKEQYIRRPPPVDARYGPRACQARWLAGDLRLAIRETRAMSSVAHCHSRIRRAGRKHHWLTEQTSMSCRVHAGQVIPSIVCVRFCSCVCVFWVEFDKKKTMSEPRSHRSVEIKGRVV